VHPRNLVLAGLAVAVAGIMLYLFLAVRGGPAAVAPADLAAARARHEAEAARSAAARPAPSAPSDDRGEFDRRLTEHRARPGRIRDVTHAEPGLPDIPPSNPEGGPATGPTIATGEPEPVLDAQMQLSAKLDEANRLYDKADYETAQQRAIDVLREAPDNVRMMRIVVSTSCMMGQEDQARKYYGTLPERDKIQMAVRCERYGIKFE
jgi:hypothetical protein